MGKVQGVLCHHTGGPLTGDLPDIDVLVKGRPDLPGPLSQLALGRSGTFYILAAGKGWHAGAGNWQGVTDGNSHFIGIEAENTGETTGPRADPWPEVQLDAYARGCAAILKHIGATVSMAAGHKEYATPKGRKNDPTFDMAAFRSRISSHMGASTMEVASIRCKNPGAMWGRTGKKPDQFFPTPQGPRGVETNAPIPLKWHSKKTIYLADGLAQGNNIAIFDNFVDGICAQLDLWRSSANYKNKRFADAIHTWAGGNNVPSYISYVKARVPGITEDTIMDDKFWKGPMAIPFLKAQAGHEAGKPYPAADADWIEAQKRVFAPSVAQKTTEAAVVVATTASTTTVAIQAGWSWMEIGLTAFIVAGAAVAIVAMIRKVRS